VIVTVICNGLSAHAKEMSPHLLLLVCLFLRFGVSAVTGGRSYDVVVYGATPAGISAAVAAAHGGRNSVALIEPLGMIGGMGAAGGLALHDQQMANLTMITGLARRWASYNSEYYNTTVLVNHPDMYVAEASFQRMIQEAKSIELFKRCRLTSAAKTGPRVSAVGVLCNENVPRTFEGKMFIDASYDGEIVVNAGNIDFTYGRESTAVYNESLAGVQRVGESLESFEGLNVSATWANGTLLKYVSKGPVPKIGSGDDKLMAFQHRACVTTDKSRSTPFPKPEGYNPDDFQLLLRQINAVMRTKKNPEGPPLDYFTDLGNYSPAVAAAGRSKYILCCGTGPVDSDQPDINQGWALANHSVRQRIIKAHTYYLQGSLYFLGNDPNVPEFTRKDVGRFGLCADEFVEFGNWPPQLYIRASVRLIGHVVMTQNNLILPRSKKDSVSMACWELDQHTMSRYAVEVKKGDGATSLQAQNEGFFRHSIDPSVPPESKDKMDPHDLWYDVPFQVMVPKRTQAVNLLVPVALSSSSVAFSSLRIETMYMDLGSAAGAAARQIVEGGLLRAVQEIDIQEVQRVLTEEFNQRIHGPFWET
jgi:hypothetical protein